MSFGDISKDNMSINTEFVAIMKDGSIMNCGSYFTPLSILLDDVKDQIQKRMEKRYPGMVKCITTVDDLVGAVSGIAAGLDGPIKQPKESEWEKQPQDEPDFDTAPTLIGDEFSWTLPSTSLLRRK